MKKRRIFVDGDIAHVKLTQGYTSIIDAADVALLEGHTWLAHRKGGTVYAATQVRIDEGKQHLLYMHRLILGLADSALYADHIDGYGLNNRRSNLRACSCAENQRNRPAPRNNTSGFKGVCWNAKSRRWQANIGVNGKLKYLGLFDAPEAAYAAYCAAAAELHGKFARAA